MKIKYSVPISAEKQKELTQEYKEFCQSNPMTAKERKALLKWVKDGNSVYNNKERYRHGKRGKFYTFLEVYREKEWIYKSTKDLNTTEIGIWISLNTQPFRLLSQMISELFDSWVKERGYEENFGWLDHMDEQAAVYEKWIREIQMD